MNLLLGLTETEEYKQKKVYFQSSPDSVSLDSKIGEKLNKHPENVNVQDFLLAKFEKKTILYYVAKVILKPSIVCHTSRKNRVTFLFS